MGYDFERHRVSYLVGTSTDWIALLPRVREPETIADWPDRMLWWLDPTIETDRTARISRVLVDEPDRFHFVDGDGTTRELRPVTPDVWGRLKHRAIGKPPTLRTVAELEAFFL